jgi:hypothetical protein
MQGVRAGDVGFRLCRSNGPHMRQCAMTQAQLDELKRQLDMSETLHHKIMAKMADPKFDLLEAWGRKEKLDAEIGRFIRTALNATA